MRNEGIEPGFSWKEDATGVMCSKRGAYEAALAEHSKMIATGKKLQAMLDGCGSGGSGTQPGNGGDTGSGAAQQAAPSQQAAEVENATDPVGGRRAAKKRRR